MSSFIPETAPFNEEQRAWLNGFFAGMTGVRTSSDSGSNAGTIMATAGIATESLTVAEEEEDFPWHDASLPIVERIDLADGKPIERKLMAAMAQLDCGSCGYLCQTYAEAIASGDEGNLTLCSPGGKETKQMIKRLLKDDGGVSESNGKATTNGTSANGTASGYSRSHPYPAPLIESRPLNQEGSAKDTRHVAIDLSGSGLKYEVGDALGVYPENCSELVAKIIDQIGADPAVPVTTIAGVSKPLRDALREDHCLKDPSDELLELVIGRAETDSAKAMMQTMLDDGTPEGFDVLDVLEVSDCKSLSCTEFLETLEPLNPRLYSIASSMKHVGDQVHLTVGKVIYQREGRVRKGVASTMLADRVEENAKVRVFTQPNHGGFTVPANESKPMIMVGPGTGIAPFMTFLQERAAKKSPGKNWLFFGDQYEAFDFLYEDELKGYVDQGVLTKLDTAFSRDGDEKVYVQDRMRENASEIWQWIKDGSHFYVCGDASRMAADVETALIDIVENQGGMSATDAKSFVKQLATDQRYVRDVY